MVTLRDGNKDDLPLVKDVHTAATTHGLS